MRGGGRLRLWVGRVGSGSWCSFCLSSSVLVLALLLCYTMYVVTVLCYTIATVFYYS